MAFVLLVLPLCIAQAQASGRMTPPDTNSDPQMRGLRAQLLPLAERVASQFDIKLDYTPASITDVERILGRLHDEYRRTNDTQGFKGLALEFGAYLVEVIDRRYGPGRWERDDARIGPGTMPYTARGITVFPVAWCQKRLIDGPSDDIVAKYRTFAQQLEAVAPSGH